MELAKLKEIIALADKNAIIRELKALGYEDASKSRKYRDFSLTKIVHGEQKETEWVNGENRLEYSGHIYTNVEGADGAEFVAISVNKIDKQKDMSIPYTLMWFVKEV